MQTTITVVQIGPQFFVLFSLIFRVQFWLYLAELLLLCYQM
jgi:hypothetical protein